MVTLREVYEELGAPAPLALFIAARRRGLNISRLEARRFTDKEGARQIFAARQPSKGKVVSEDLNTRFVADLMDFKNAEVTAGEEESKNVLVLVNVFSRKIWAQAMPTKTDAATTDAMRTILQGFEEEDLPKLISVDGGAEFKGKLFLEFMHELDVALRLKDGPNTLAPGDRAIQSLKLTMAKMMATQRGSWQAMLPRAVAALNKTPKTVLHNTAPEDVEDEDQVKFMLLQDAARGVVHNKEVLQKRRETLAKAGAFRAPAEGLERKTFKRGNDATYGAKKELDHIEGSTAVATDGTRIDVKHLKPVDPESTGAVARLGDMSEAKSTVKRRADAQPIRALTRAFLRHKERESLNALAAHLKYRLRAATLTYEQILAKTKLKLVGVLRLYPTVFEVDQGRYVKLIDHAP